jgi:hypothetical protein
MFKKKSDDLSKYLQENAPSIAFWVAALILITFDIHVVDVMWNITSSYLLAAGSLFSTGVMFLSGRIISSTRFPAELRCSCPQSAW